jgi:phosphonopyruvate decarboxylase
MMDRRDAISLVLESLASSDVVVTTTGLISREAFRVMDRRRNFYMLGSMGLASAFGLGLAILLPTVRVFVVEGDGSALMNLGALAQIGASKPANLFHIILDNHMYESTGGQASISSATDMAAIGTNCGYASAIEANDTQAVVSAMRTCRLGSGPQLIVVDVDATLAPLPPRVGYSPSCIRDRLADELAHAKT